MPATWSPFRRRDLAGLVRLVRDVAASGDPGTFGHGVEVVVESPRLHWWQRIFDRTLRDQARIAVTGEQGRVGYPVHVRLVTGHGSGAAHKVERRDGWATSVTAMVPAGDRSTVVGHGHPHEKGEAILMLKRGTRPDWDPGDAAAELAEGTVSALDDLHPFSPDKGWRVRVDREVQRS